jgi:GntR family transcriptional regulator
MQINKTSPLPVYYQLKQLILACIAAGEYRPGQPIPSERELGEMLKISRMTVRQAINQLVAVGVLYREKGKGTFVAKTKIEQRNIMSFSAMVRNKGLVPTTQVLCFKKELTDPGRALLLDLREDEAFYHLQRLRLADNTPIGVEEVFIPEKFCPDLERFDLTASLYQLIREEYSLAISYVDNQIESSPPTGEERKLLKITGEIPVIRISGKSFTAAGISLFYERSIYRADEYKYSVRVYMDN